MEKRQLLIRVGLVVLTTFVLLAGLDRDGAKGRRATALSLAAELAEALRPETAVEGAPGALEFEFELLEKDDAALTTAKDRLLSAHWIQERIGAPKATLSLSQPTRAHTLGGLFDEKLTLSLEHPGATLVSGEDSHTKTSSVSRAAIGAFALAPPLLAILMAFGTRKLTLSLVSAILLGAVLSDPSRFYTLGVDKALIEYGLKTTGTDPSKLWILVFTTALIGLVGVAQSSGGVHGIVNRLMVFAKGRRATMVATTLMGFCIFFDDYANTILVGGTMRPLTDRLRISREKLAYLVDSTSAPVAGVALISTWIGYEVGLFADLSRSLGLSLDGYQFFFAALPFRFYCLFTLAFLAILLFFNRDFGPMARAEERALRTGQVLREGAVALSGSGMESLNLLEGMTPRAHLALQPIGLTLGGTLIGLLWDGGGLDAALQNPGLLLSFTTWREAFGNAEHSTFVLAMASISGSVLVIGLVIGERVLSPRQTASSYLRGVRSMAPAVLILVLAWAIKAACDDVGTSAFLVAWLQEQLSPQWLPGVIFLLSALVAFATGTSWGTMGILIPTAVPLAFHLGGQETMFIAAAAVLDGAIFGDHCSPISDTTVMSSIACGSDHLDHVRTQIPYALTTMFGALLFGYFWWGFGAPYPLGLLAGGVTLALIVRFIGRKIAPEIKLELPRPT